MSMVPHEYPENVFALARSMIVHHYGKDIEVREGLRENSLIAGQLWRFILYNWSELDEQEQNVTMLLWGLGDGYCYAESQVTTILRISQSEVLDLSKAALAKLCHPTGMIQIRNILEG